MTENAFSLRVWALAPVLALGPTLTCGIPRIMAPLFIISAILTIAADCFMRRSRPTIDKRLGALFGALLMFGVISFMWTVNPDESLSKVGQLAAIFLPAACLVSIVGRMSAPEIKQIGWLVAVGLGLGIAVYFLEYAFNYPFYDLMHGPNTDMVDNKVNKAAVLLALWLYMLLAFLRGVRGATIATVLVMVVGYATFISPSGSAKVVLAAAVVYGALTCLIPPRISAVMVFVSVCLLAIGMPFIAHQVANDTHWQTTPYLNSSVKSRIEIWDQASRRSMEKPFFGWGLNAAPRIPNRDEQSYTRDIPIHHLHPHNGLLHVWEELGALGVAMLCGLFWIFYSRIRDFVSSPWSQKYAVFMWGVVFAYTLSIWGLWQTWFAATLTFMGIMTYVGMRRIAQADDNAGVATDAPNKAL